MKIKNKKIVFVTKTLQIGGVERALVTLVNSVCSDFDVKVVVFDRSLTDLKEELSQKVNVEFVSKLQFYYMIADKEHRDRIPPHLAALKALLRIFEVLGVKRYFEMLLFKEYGKEHCDYAVSYTGYPGPWDSLVLSYKAQRKISYIHNNPYALGLDRIDAGKYYEAFDEIICVSKDIQTKLNEISPPTAAKSRVVYNLIDRDRIDLLSREPFLSISDNKKKIVTVARIENNSKRFDRMIECVSVMRLSGFHDFEWHMIGGGPDFDFLKKLIRDYEAEEYVFLEGFQKNPYKYIKNADLFVLASDYEGLPVTLMETIYLEIPVVVTNFSCAAEIVEDGVNGLIVEKNADSLARGIIRVLTDDELYSSMKKAMSMKYKPG